jgi:hypothetical protein
VTLAGIVYLIIGITVSKKIEGVYTLNLHELGFGRPSQDEPGYFFHAGSLVSLSYWLIPYACTN